MQSVVTVACITNHTPTSTYDEKMHIHAQTYGQEQRVDVSTIAHACTVLTLNSISNKDLIIFFASARKPTNEYFNSFISNGINGNKNFLKL